jgi:hypothetical protein
MRMTHRLTTNKYWPILGLVLLLLLFALGIWAAPQESALGEHIKVVYVHVALTWTGMLGLLAAGVLGIGLAIRPNPRLYRLLYAVAVVGFGFFVGGTIVSFMAQRATWGGILWQEPRMRSALQVIAVAVIVLTSAELTQKYRWLGVAFALLAAFMLWSTQSATLVMHPRDPITPSSSVGIRSAFYGLFGLSSAAAGVLLVAMVRRR